MKLPLLVGLPLLAGLAVAAPARQDDSPPPLVASPGDVDPNLRIVGLSVLGTGCPAGHADVLVDLTGTLFTVIFDRFTASTGLGTGAADWRKNCNLGINLAYNSGLTFSILSTDTIGYAQVLPGSTATITNDFNFVGQPRAHFELQINGPFQKSFDLTANPDLVTWSRCGNRTAILNMNTAIALSPTTQPGLVGVDLIQGTLQVLVHLVWRSCA